MLIQEWHKKNIKRKRVVFKISKKIEMIEKLEKGTSVKVCAVEYGVGD